MTDLNNTIDKNIAEDFLVIISLRGISADSKICGVLNNTEFSLSNSASYSEGFSNAGVKMVADAFNKVTKNAFEKGTDALSSGTLNSTVSTYGSSGASGFSISCNIIPGQLGMKYDLKDIVKNITALTQPNIYSKSATGSTGKLSVFGYTPNITATASATSLTSNLYSVKDKARLLADPYAFDGKLIHVKIGDWFEASGLYCTSAGITNSTILDENGMPLYIKVEFSFQSYRVLSAEEISKMYKV